MPVVSRLSFWAGMTLIGLGLAEFGGGTASVAAGANASQVAAGTAAIPPGVARVWFLRQFQPGESLQMPMIYVNGAPLAASQPGTMFFRDFPPGSYAFSVETCTQDFNQTATPTLVPGSETYLEVQSLSTFRSWDCIADTFYVRAIPAEWAQRYFQQLTYLGAG